jgi:hypothetical protein
MHYGWPRKAEFAGPIILQAWVVCVRFFRSHGFVTNLVGPTRAASAKLAALLTKLRFGRLAQQCLAGPTQTSFGLLGDRNVLGNADVRVHSGRRRTKSCQRCGK